MFQMGGSEKVNCMGSSSPFRPSGHTTWSPHCKTLHTSSWPRHPQAFMLGVPSITTLMCPSLDRGVCNTPSLGHAKAYTQSLPLLISSACLHAASLREWVWTCFRCVHTATRPNTLSPLMVLSGTIKRHTISSLGYIVLLSISLTWNCEGGRDHVTPIPLGLMAPIGQHLWRSGCSHSFSLL